MAEILQQQTGRRKKIVPRIDLTPMVDLAFLLITFFIFTATLSEPTAMTTLLPADSNDSTYIPLSGAVTILAGSNQWAMYEGEALEELKPMSYKNINVLRQTLLAKQRKLIAINGNDDALFVMIKPTESAQFKEVVQLLDEMKICQMKRYTLTDINEQEKLVSEQL